MMTTLATERFSVHYSEWLGYNWVTQIQLHNFDTGWVLCHFSM